MPHRTLTRTLSSLRCAVFWELHQNQSHISQLHQWLGEQFNFPGLLNHVGPANFLSVVAALRLSDLSLALMRAPTHQHTELQAQMKEALGVWQSEQAVLATRALGRQRIEQWLNDSPITKLEQKRLNGQIETLHRLGYSFVIEEGSQKPRLEGMTIRIGDQHKIPVPSLVFFFNQAIIGTPVSLKDEYPADQKMNALIPQWIRENSQRHVDQAPRIRDVKQNAENLRQKFLVAVASLMHHHWQFVRKESSVASIRVDFDTHRIFLSTTKLNANEFKTLADELIIFADGYQAFMIPPYELLISKYGHNAQWTELSHKDRTLLALWVHDKDRSGKTALEFKTKIYPKLISSTTSTVRIRGTELENHSHELEMLQRLAVELGVSDGLALRDHLEQLELAFKQRSESVSTKKAAPPQELPNVVQAGARLKELRPWLHWNPLINHKESSSMLAAVLALIDPSAKVGTPPNPEALVKAATAMGYPSAEAFRADLFQTPKQFTWRWRELGIYNPSFHRLLRSWSGADREVLATLLNTLLRQGSTHSPVTLASLAVAFQQLRPHAQLQAWMKRLADAIPIENQGYPRIDLKQKALTEEQRAIAEVLVRLKPYATMKLDTSIDRLLDKR